MNESAVHDLLTQNLKTWYGKVSEWMPNSSESVRTSDTCRRELAVVIDPEAWPRELVDSLAQLVNELVIQVTESFLEEPWGDTALTEASARSAVMRALMRQRGDIADVLEHCIRYRLEAFDLLELELAELGGF